MANIGEPLREIEVEPIQIPVPERAPETLPVPESEPVEEPELVPVRSFR